MAIAEKTCAVPTAKDKLVIVEDDNCKSTMAATTYPSINGSGSGYITFSEGTTNGTVTSVR